MPSRSLNTQNAPNQLQTFIQNRAMLNRMAQMGQMGQQQVNNGLAPRGMIAQNLGPGQIAPNYINPQAGAFEEQAKNAMRSSESFNKALNVIKVAFPIMKGAYAQQGGQSGFIPGMVGGIAAKIGLPNTYNIGSLHQAFNDVTANIAQQYSGNQGISRLFNAFSSGTPEGTDSEQNAFAKLVTAGKTAYGIAKGVANAGLTNDQLRSLSPDQVQKIVGNPHNNYSQDEGKMIEDLFSEEYKNTSGAVIPNPSTGVREPLQPNVLNRGISSIFPSANKFQSSNKENDPLGVRS